MKNYANQGDFLGYPAIEELDANGGTLQGNRGNTVLEAHMVGIYLVTNLMNGKQYIGASTDIKRRWSEHVTPKNIQKRNVLARAIRKYGKNSFGLSVLEVCLKEHLSERERFWIERLRPAYNMNEGGDGNLGHKVSVSVRNLLSSKSRERWSRKTDAEKKAIIINNLCGPRKGHSVSALTRDKIRRKLSGKLLSQEHAHKISVSNKTAMRMNTNGNKSVIAIYRDGSARYFPSIKTAAVIFGIHPSCITHALKGEQFTAGGQRWQYMDDSSVETNGDECNRVGRIISHRSKLVATRQGVEDIVHSSAMAKPRAK